ncbi:MAG: anthranilate phosphoribosyltransferase [Acetanaerobacterium sp.]
MIKEALKSLMEHENLTYETASTVMDEIMNGETTPAQMASFLTALRMKGESIDEITACANVMRAHCTRLVHEGEVLEVVGTGGDEAFTFNISTISAFVAAAAGAKVAKHGNRSVSSKCGAADLLEELGARIDLTAEQSAQVLENTGFCFMYAPLYHASMKYAAPVRRELGVRTIFNILGPLANPAGATMQLLGVYSESLVKPLAKVLSNLGVVRGLVVHGSDGLDEITLTGPTTVCEIDGKRLKNYVLNPKELGLDLCQSSDLVGGDPKRNADIVSNILQGERCPKRDVVVLNAAACLYLSGKAESIAGGVDLAAYLLDSGEACEKLNDYVWATHEV